MAKATWENGMEITYYLHGEQSNKQTHLMPHPWWMMKGGFEASKACCVTTVESVIESFTDLLLGLKLVTVLS